MDKSTRDRLCSTIVSDLLAFPHLSFNEYLAQLLYAESRRSALAAQHARNLTVARETQIRNLTVARETQIRNLTITKENQSTDLAVARENHIRNLTVARENQIRNAAITEEIQARNALIAEEIAKVKRFKAASQINQMKEEKLLPEDSTQLHFGRVPTRTTGEGFPSSPDSENFDIFDTPRNEIDAQLLNLIRLTAFVFIFIHLAQALIIITQPPVAIAVI